MQNLQGIHALVWAGDVSPASVEKIIVQSKKAGFNLIEFSLHEPKPLDVAYTRALLKEHQMQVVCSRGLAFNADVSSEDPAVVARGLDLLKEAVELTHALGGTYFGGVPYSALGKYPGPHTATGRKHVVETLRTLSKIARDKGVLLGLEVVNRYESNVLNTARQALELIDQIGEDNFVVHLDTYHMNIEEVDFVQPVLECGDKLGYVHIGESHRGYLGSGTVDFTNFFKALAQINYQGPITFESFSSTVVAAGLSNDLAVWRNLWNDGADLAVHANAYIKAMAQGAGLGVTGRPY